MPLTLTTLEEFKAHLGTTSDCEDERLSQLLEGVEAAVETYCGRKFAAAQATEYYDGHGRSLLDLRRRPVTAVASVHVDALGYYGQGPDAFADDTALVVGADFVLRRTDASEGNGGLLMAIKRPWPVGSGNIKVVYTAGYDPIPADLKLAVHMLGAATLEAAASGAIKGSETLGRYSYTLLSGGADDASGAALASTREILSHYTDLSL